MEPSNSDTIHACPEMEVSVFQGLPVILSVGVATHTQAFQHVCTTWSHFWSSGLLRVGEKAPNTLLGITTIDITI